MRRADKTTRAPRAPKAPKAPWRRARGRPASWARGHARSPTDQLEARPEKRPARYHQRRARLGAAQIEMFATHFSVPGPRRTGGDQGRRRQFGPGGARAGQQLLENVSRPEGQFICGPFCAPGGRANGRHLCRTCTDSARPGPARDEARQGQARPAAPHAKWTGAKRAGGAAPGESGMCQAARGQLAKRRARFSANNKRATHSAPVNNSIVCRGRPAPRWAARLPHTSRPAESAESGAPSPLAGRLLAARGPRNYLVALGGPPDCLPACERHRKRAAGAGREEPPAARRRASRRSCRRSARWTSQSSTTGTTSGRQWPAINK